MNDRGQLILIAAVLIAATILGSVILLNSIHASADTNAYKEGQSLDQATRATEQVQEDLRELFLAELQSDDGQPGGYITDKVAFNQTVKNYSRQYTNLSSMSSSSILWVEYNNETADKNGKVLRQNGTLEFRARGNNGGANWNPITGADDIPYMYFNITDVSAPGNQEWDLLVNGGTSLLKIIDRSGDAEVKVNGQTRCESNKNPISTDTPIEIEITNGIGRIQAEDRSCDKFALTTSDIQQIRFEKSMVVEGNYTIVGLGSSVTEDSNFGSISEQGVYDDVIVNPGFTIRYDDPSGNYEANMTAFGGNR